MESAKRRGEKTGGYGPREAGLATVLVDRRADYPQARTGAATHGHPRAESFTEIAPG